MTAFIKTISNLIKTRQENIVSKISISINISKIIIKKNLFTVIYYQ